MIVTYICVSLKTINIQLLWVILLFDGLTKKKKTSIADLLPGNNLQTTGNTEF